jgi:hypothetical protein
MSKMILLSDYKKSPKISKICKMALYRLIRKPADGKSVRGKLFLVTESRFEEVLTPICDTLENADFLIPPLYYPILVTMSPKFKRLLPVLGGVPGRSGIRIHVGSKPEHSRGCILVSKENENILTSMFLKEQRQHEECRIDICNYTNLNLKQQ